MIKTIRSRSVPLGRGRYQGHLVGPAESRQALQVAGTSRGAAAELALLRGDPSDGLPGVQASARKTAIPYGNTAR